MFGLVTIVNTLVHFQEIGGAGRDGGTIAIAPVRDARGDENRVCFWREMDAESTAIGPPARKIVESCEHRQSSGAAADGGRSGARSTILYRWALNTFSGRPQ